MLERLLEVLNIYFLEAVGLILIGLMLGEIISQIYWVGRINKKNRLIKKIKSSEKEKDSEIQELNIQSNERLGKQQAEINRLKANIRKYADSFKELKKTSNILNTKLINNKNLLKEREKKVDVLNEHIDYIENNIKVLSLQITEKEEIIDQLKKRSENDTKIQSKQIEEREEKIRNILRQQNENIAYIDQLKKETENLLQINQDALSKIKQLEAKVTEMERDLFEKTQRVTSQKNRIAMMEDDLTHILGIGLKVSTLLRSAGINSFQKLGSLDVSTIIEIIEKKNPNLLHLIDPSSWPRQAKLASEENWEALEILQESLKESKTRNRIVNEIRAHNISP